MVVRAPHEEDAKALPVVRLATHKLCVSVDTVVGAALLAKTIADNHMATGLPNFVLGMRWQELHGKETSGKKYQGEF